MKSFAMSLYTVALLSTGFYARGVCQPVTVMQQTQPEVQVAALPQDAQNAFSKLAQHLVKGGR